MNHLTEQQFVLYYYGEGAAVREHLDACETCRAQYANLQRVLNVVDSAPVPERAGDYGAEVWGRLESKLGGRNVPRRPWLAPWLWPARHWAAAAGMAALLTAAFLAGRYYPAPRQSGKMAAAQAPERILLVAVGDHLERSQMVLVELANARPGQALDITGERERAEDLVAENRLYRQTAVGTGDRSVANVLDELEPVLMEIAHSPARLTPDELENLRRRIAADGILFKVRVVGSTVRHREERAAANPAQKTL